MIAEENELTDEEMAEVVGEGKACLVIAVACAGTIGVPDFELAILAQLI